MWANEAKGAIRVDNWPDVARSYKTIAIHTHNFEGTVRIEGSLELSPEEQDWFVIAAETFTRPDTNSEKIQNRILNSRARIIWARVNIDTVQGRVDRVLLL